MQGVGTQKRCGAIDEFQIGDFVWGKIHGDLWWPGQVYDPSDASEETRFSEHLEHHVLVAYFGEKTFAWCEGSLLKPFKEEFQQMVELNSSENFIDAVNDAMYEVERCLRSDMTCYCVPADKVVQFRMGKKNDILNSSVSNYSPVAFLNNVYDIAQDISVANMLDVTLMRSWASSFHLRNGCFVKMIEDLFDEKQTDLNVLHGNLCKDKIGGDFQMNNGRVVRRPEISREEDYRKKRSIAELNLLADPEKLGAFEDETKDHKSSGLSMNKKKKKGDEGEGKVPDIDSGSTRRERKKSKYLSPPYTSGHKERSNSFKLIDSETSENDSEKSLNMETMFPTYVDVHEDFIKENDDGETHSSMYNEASTNDILEKLLFVAGSPLHLVKNNSSFETVRDFFVKHRSFAYSGNLEIEGLSKQPGDSRTSGNYHEIDIDDDNKVISRRRRSKFKSESKLENVLGVHQNGEKRNKDEATSEPQKSDFCLNGVGVSKGRLRSRGKRGTQEPVEISDYIVINSLEEGNSGQSENELPISSCHKRKSNADVTNGEQKLDFDHDNSGKSVVRSKRTKLVEGSNENSVALLLTFSPGVTLPSKEELFLVFSKYGALIKHETELFRDPGCARVVFARETDAKKAMNGIKKSNNFPFSVVDCQSFDLPYCPDISSRSESDPSDELTCISQDLRRMVGMLSSKKGQFSHGLKPEVRKDLINDIKALLNKVNKLIA